MSENPKKWYKTAGGAIFLGLIILILTGGILFLGLTGYYLWQLKFGDAESLTKQFTPVGDFLPPAERPIPSDPTKLIRAHNPTQGGTDAPITIISFIDFECPFCRQEYTIFKKVLEKYGGAVNFVFKHTPITATHPEALGAHLAAACAHEQNQFWPYYDLLFEKQKLDRASLLDYTVKLGINNKQFTDCFETEKYLTEIEADLKDAQAIGLRGTPTHLVNGLKIEGVSSETQWNKMILDVLQK